MVWGDGDDWFLVFVILFVLYVWFGFGFIV